MLKVCSAVLALGLSCSAVASELVIETWRIDDAALWKEQILPRFHAKHPDINVTLAAVSASEYQATLDQRLTAGQAGDLISCRPYDESLQLFKKGYLEDLTDQEGMENFPSFAKAAWQTDTGAQTFCMPIASVIQGFYYNLDIFKTLGLDVPKTREQFFAVMDKVKADGRYQPLALAAHDNWVVSELGFQNIGPNYWHGEDGRLALIEGKARLTDPAYVGVFEELSRWLPYLGANPADVTEAQAVEAFQSGKTAMMVAGSWAISQFDGKVNFGAFPPPVAKEGDACYFTDHTDIGIAINAKSKNKEAARQLLEWMASAEFAELYSNAVPGFFSLSNHFFELKNPVASTMMSWRDSCDSTIRVAAQILSRGDPSLSQQLNDASQQVVLGTLAPQAAAEQLQQSLAAWYEPQKNGTSSNAQVCQPAIQAGAVSGAVSSAVTTDAAVLGRAEEALLNSVSAAASAQP